MFINERENKLRYDKSQASEFDYERYDSKIIDNNKNIIAVIRATL